MQISPFFINIYIIKIDNMGFLSFNDFINRKPTENHSVETTIENNDSYHFTANESYSNGNREEVDELLYEYVCNYVDDNDGDYGEDEMTLEGLWNYINDDNTLSEKMKNNLGEYIDVCSESITDTFGEI